MNKDTFVKDMYAIVDAREGSTLAAMMTENGIFRFANMPAVQGREAIVEFLDNFFQSINAIKHEDLEDWQDGDTRFATGTVTYTRHNDTSLSVPFSVILKMKEKLIHEFLVFVDASELYK